MQPYAKAALLEKSMSLSKKWTGSLAAEAQPDQINSAADAN